ncbi:ferredoxin [Anaeromyxobacter sp. PSR-1]|nr:ferredoxin [Anaeromyxobacter sp. PSR-1]
MHSALPRARATGATVAHASRCLNARQPRRACDACTACPTGALRIAPGLAVDAHLCAGCGLCAASCPAGGLEKAGPTAADVRARGREGERLELVCSARGDRRSTRAPGVEALLEVGCLASLSTELLFVLAAEHGSVWLDDSGCAACELGSTRPAAERAANLAKRMLAGWGRERAILSYTRDDALLERRPHPVRDLGDARPRATRRQFLSIRRRPDRDGLARGAGRADLLACGLRSLGRPTVAASLPPDRFARIRVVRSCSGCGACAKICPTAALRAAASPSRFVLELTPAACLGPACGVCALACPIGAISTDAPADTSWLSGDGETIADLPMTSCDECHAPVAQGGDGLCESCRKRRAERGSLIGEVLAGPRRLAER